MAMCSYRFSYNGATWDVGGFGSVGTIGDISLNWNGTTDVLEVDWSAISGFTYDTQPAIYCQPELTGVPATPTYAVRARQTGTTTAEIAFYDAVTCAHITTEGTLMRCYFMMIGRIS
jgi:hypothetical protein